MLAVVRPRHRSLAFASLALSAALGAFACTTDFTVGRGTVAGDASSEASADDAAASDAASDAATPSCETLERSLGVQLNAAITCPMAGAICPSRLTDECGCVLGAPDLTNAAVTRYMTLRDEAVDAGCTARCRACPSPPTFLCTETDAGNVCQDPTVGSF